MYYFVLATHPKTDNPEYGSTDGGFASCWVRASGPDEAARTARALLHEAGWETEELVEEPRAIGREEYLDDPEKLDLFDEAAGEGIAMTLQTWPVGGADDASG